jgi:hypothetical protein
MLQTKLSPLLHTSRVLRCIGNNLCFFVLMSLNMLIVGEHHGVRHRFFRHRL